MKTNLHERATAIGNESRVKLLSFLAKVRRITVSELSSYVGLRSSVVSKHLEILADSGFVVKTPCGRYTYVELSVDGLNDFARSIVELMQAEDQEDIWGDKP